MPTTYVVLRVHSTDHARVDVETRADAANAEKACRMVAETLTDDDLEDGITLIAVPARNWDSGRHTLKAETQRRIRSA